MKKQLLSILLGSLIGISAKATVNTSTSKAQKESSANSNMIFTVGFAVSPKSEVAGFGYSPITYDIKSSYTLGFGYQELSVRDFGYEAAVEYTIASISTVGFTNISLVGNANYGLNEKAYALAGLNYSYMSSIGFETNGSGSGFGFQLGIGFNINEKINFEIVRKNQIADLTVGGESGTVDNSAFELRSQYLF